jgi:hypothetical protein
LFETKKILHSLLAIEEKMYLGTTLHKLLQEGYSGAMRLRIKPTNERKLSEERAKKERRGCEEGAKSARSKHKEGSKRVAGAIDIVRTTHRESYYAQEEGPYDRTDQCVAG